MSSKSKIQDLRIEDGLQALSALALELGYRDGGRGCLESLFRDNPNLVEAVIVQVFKNDVDAYGEKLLKSFRIETVHKESRVYEVEAVDDAEAQTAWESYNAKTADECELVDERPFEGEEVNSVEEQDP